jgi:hypothetical protein
MSLMTMTMAGLSPVVAPADTDLVVAHMARHAYSQSEYQVPNPRASLASVLSCLSCCLLVRH